MMMLFCTTMNQLLVPKIHHTNIPDFLSQKYAKNPPQKAPGEIWGVSQVHVSQSQRMMCYFCA
jgi:hypothetical protein